MSLYKRRYVLEIIGLLMAGLVLFLVQNAYSEFNKIGQITTELNRYQSALREDVYSVHLLLHEKPLEQSLLPVWRDQGDALFAAQKQHHEEVMAILSELDLPFNRDLHTDMTNSLENLNNLGQLELHPENSEFTPQQIDEAFDHAFHATLSLLEPHQQDIQNIINGHNRLIRLMFEELMETLLILFVLMVGLLAWYQQRARRLHNQVQEQAEASQAVTNNLVDGVLTMDGAGIILSANPVMEQILGYRPEELIGNSIEMLMPREHRGKHGDYVGKYITTGVRKIIGVGRKIEGRHKDGHLVPLYLGVSEYAVDGQRCFAGILHDVTQEIARERELMRARDRAEAGSRAKSEFLSAMTHEVRTPLNGIMGALSLLRMDAVGKHKEYAELAYKSSEDLLRLLEAVLEYSRMEENGVELNPVEVEIRPFCQELLAAHHTASEQKQLSVRSEVHEHVPHFVRVDILRLRQLLDHLLANAIKFTNEGGYSLELSLLNRNGQPWLKFEICDTGEGVDAEHQKEIFLAFKQVDGSLTRRHGGMGLGLAICSRLAKALGGELTLESSIGAGSCFCLQLPVEVGEQSGFDSSKVANSA